MDRAVILQHLKQAEGHVRQGEIHVTNQRLLVETLERDGHDTTQARALLKEFIELQALHVADRDRLRGELAALSTASVGGYLWDTRGKNTNKTVGR